MMRKVYDVVVIGGGPAGMAAAVSAQKNGAENILIIERDRELGGILNQCIHNGFGLHYFKSELTGPEYAMRFIDMVNDKIDVLLDTMVLEIRLKDKNIKEVWAAGSHNGYCAYLTKTIVLAMGCRERSRGGIAIPGDRPSGVFTAGTAQWYVNIGGYMIGKKIVILGSGDIGLIMARRLTLEGAKVLACVEIMPYSNGLARNIVQCLNDYDIPLYLSHTITNIKGKDRVQGVTIAKVDHNRKPIAGTETELDCDTVLLSVGLIPENELTREVGISMDAKTNGAIVYENMETSINGIFACGNVLQVHDLVDFVTLQSEKAGKSAALSACGKDTITDMEPIQIVAGKNVNFTVPQFVRSFSNHKLIEVFFRTNAVYRDASIFIRSGGEKIHEYKRSHMAPSEMEKVIITCSMLDKAASIDGRISISVEKRGEEQWN